MIFFFFLADFFIAREGQESGLVILILCHIRDLSVAVKLSGLQSRHLFSLFVFHLKGK